MVKKNINPKVFICHAGEDNKFALQLAEKLIKNGVDPWIDDWEIRPGDKLIDKIFYKGIGQCDIFIIILSEASITKPWVQEELDAALIKRIDEQTKLIPLRIDNSEIPIPLKATAWLNLDRSKDLDVEIQPLLSSIFDKTIKPKIGKIPSKFSYAEKVDEYNIVESAVLKCVIELYKSEGERFIQGKEIQEKTGYTPDEINDAVEILENDGLLKVDHYAGTVPFRFGTVRNTALGYVKYAPIFFDINTEYELRTVLSYIVSTNKWVMGQEIQKSTNIEPISMNMYIDYLELLEYIKVMRYAGTVPFYFGQVKPTAEGKRALREKLD